MKLLDKIEIANNLVKLLSEYKSLASECNLIIPNYYSDSVAQAILLLGRVEKEGVNNG